MELSPSWPALFLPQHFTAPAVVSAQVWPAPATIAITPLAKPLTETGVRRLVCVPSPSCPLVFVPQHLTAPPLVSAQLWTLPTATEVTPLVRPLTCVGVRAGFVEPSPIWPPLLSPQHLT